jgi:hypothetical protein
MLYAGTDMSLPRKGWDKDARNLCVESLAEHNAPVAAHFSSPEVQYIGSTSGCGCDFPHVILTRGEWIGYPQVDVDDPEREASERFNREALVTLLREGGEKVVELYGIWLSNDGDYTKQANVRENISLSRILEPDFRFKERGLYQVSL